MPTTSSDSNRGRYLSSSPPRTTQTVMAPPHVKHVTNNGSKRNLLSRHLYQVPLPDNPHSLTHRTRNDIPQAPKLQNLASRTAAPEHVVSRYTRLASRRWGEHNATMTERSLADLAESAGEELALRLRIPCDIVDVHRINNSRAKIYSSLRYGAFLLAYAPLESFFTQLTWYAERANGRALPLNPDKIQRELDLQWPDARFQANLWEGRT